MAFKTEIGPPSSSQLCNGLIGHQTGTGVSMAAESQASPKCSLKHTRVDTSSAGLARKSPPRDCGRWSRVSTPQFLCQSRDVNHALALFTGVMLPSRQSPVVSSSPADICFTVSCAHSRSSRVNRAHGSKSKYWHRDPLPYFYLREDLADQRHISIAGLQLCCLFLLEIGRCEG